MGMVARELSSVRSSRKRRSEFQSSPSPKKDNYDFKFRFPFLHIRHSSSLPALAAKLVYSSDINKYPIH